MKYCRSIVWGILSWCLVFCLVNPGYAQKKSKGGREKEKETSSRFRLEEETLATDGMKYMLLEEPDRAIPYFEKLVKKQPNEAAGYFMMANALIKQNKTEEASGFAKQAYNLEKTNQFYAYRLAEIYVIQKKYKDAIEIYEILTAANPENIQYGLELASVYVFNGQFEKSIAAYDKLEKAIGITEEVSHQKKQLYLKLNQLDKAINEIQRLSADESNETDYLIELAELYIANQKYDLAIPELEKALKLNSDEPQAHILLADIYRRQGNREKCNQELQLIFSNPNIDSGPKVRVLSGYLSMVSNETERNEALALTRQLIQTHPKESKGYVVLADLYVQNGKKKEARDTYAKAARMDGSVYEVWGALLQLDGELNDIDSLLVHSEMALEVFPSQGMVWYSNGSANLMKRNYKRAISSLEESKKLLSNNVQMKRFINSLLGDAYNGTGEHQKSDQAYDLVLKEEPDNDHVLNNYSYFLSLRRENMDKALEMSERLVKLNATNATYLDTHAWVLYIRKDYVRSKTYLEKALADTSNVSPTIVEHYGDVLFKLGEKEKALEQWKKAKTMGQSGDLINKKIASGILHES